jgi:RNA polymerase sigma-70 factor (ECF subfamily)
MNLDDTIAGCIQNDRKSQEILYKYFFEEMWRMCYRYTQDEDRIISIINDGFLKVFKNIDTYKGKGSFEGWVRRIVYHALSDYFRKENKYLKFLVLEEDENRSAEAYINQNLYYADLQAIVERLPNMAKQVFTLYAIGGYSHQEIGDRLSISEGTSKWHLNQARKKLKVLLSTTYNGIVNG